jgi:hypothetical protein
MPNESVKDRRVDAYLTPCNNTFFQRYVERNDVSNSKAVNEAIEALKKTLSPSELKIIMTKNNY